MYASFKDWRKTVRNIASLVVFIFIYIITAGGTPTGVYGNGIIRTHLDILI